MQNQLIAVPAQAGISRDEPEIPAFAGMTKSALSKSLPALMAVLLLTLPAHAGEPERIAEQSKDYVSEVLPYPIDEVYGRTQLLFDSSKRDYYEDYNPKIYDLPEEVLNYKNLSPRAYKKFMALPLVRPNKFYVFYGAYPMMQEMLARLTPLDAMSQGNVALERYTQLPLQSRAQDMYIWSPDTPYWYSEYRRDGEPVPFKSFFIVHLSAVDETHTQVEVIEHEPVVRLGRTMSVDVHNGVRDYAIRKVEPTTSDREFLLSCISQFIERKVPGRHWFNCRAKGEPEPEKPVPFTVP